MGELIRLSDRRAAGSGRRRRAAVASERASAGDRGPESIPGAAAAVAAVAAFAGASRERRHTDAPAGGATPVVTFVYDPACAWSYLAAERVERLFGRARWTPARGGVPGASHDGAAERRAAELRLPLVWPERLSTGGEAGVALYRVAAHATAIGAGDRFALAAARLAFCGGFDLSAPEILAEAAAAAGISAARCRAAASDPKLDGALAETAAELAAGGVSELPAVRVGWRWFAGEQGLARAMAARAAG